MYFHHIPLEPVLPVLLSLLKTFGLIPGALCAYGVRRFYQKWRQNRAIQGWPVADARIHSAHVHLEGMRSYWVEITYTYFVDEYRVGKHVHRFRHREQAVELVSQVKEKHVQVHYDSANPDTSVILDRDLEMIALLTPQYR